ncbi:Benzoate 1,2-dioxygenase electron transfer component [compost metagenome]
MVLAPAAYWAQPVGWLVALCAAVGSVCALLSLSGRIGRRRTYKGVVSAIERPGERMLEVTCRLEGQGWSHRAGQFAFLQCERLEGPHPFTISSADRGTGEVRFSIKALGDYTQRLQGSLRVGDPVQVEGPYGRFDFRRGGGRQVWIAGGIGVTPFLAWLESLEKSPGEAPEIELHYCVRSPSDAVYAGRLRELCEGLPSVRLLVHYSEKEGRLRADDLQLSVDAMGVWPSVWFCGPQGLAEPIKRGLKRRGMPPGNFHQEAFQMR